jgi:hypothetical protein
MRSFASPGQLHSPPVSRASEAQADDGGAATATVLGGVREGDDEGVAREQRLDGRALHADALAVDQANLDEAARVRGLQVVVNDVADVAGQEAVEVERVLDGQGDRLVVRTHAARSL